MRTYSLQSERNYSDRYWESAYEARLEQSGYYPGRRVALSAATEHELADKVAELLNEFDLSIGDVTDYGFEQGSDRFQIFVTIR